MKVILVVTALAALVGLCSAQSQFSDLLGLGKTIPSQQKSRSRSQENSRESRSYEEEDYATFRELFAENLPKTSPSRNALGFGKRPMSFMTNFKTDVQFDDRVLSRVKRSRLPVDVFDLQAAASAQRISPAIVASMFQRNLFLAEDSGLPVHEAVPPVPHQPAGHPVAHHPMPARLQLKPEPHHPMALSHHHQMIHHRVEPHQPAHHAEFTGYPQPKKGGSLEAIFGLQNGKYAAPVTPVYHPEPEYSAPTPAYHPPPAAPGPAYKEPLVAHAHHPSPAYHEPTKDDFKGHPFSMEMVFGLPMHGYYMKKYRHMLPFHTPQPEYHVPVVTPAYKPEPEYHPAPAYKEPEYHPAPAYKEPEYHPAPAYKEPEYHAAPTPAYHPPMDPSTHYLPPKHGGTLEDVFKVASKYHTPVPAPAYKEPEYHPEPAYKPKPHEIKYMPEPHYGYHNSYSAYYLPYEDYVPHSPEGHALKSRIPTHPGAAHVLVRAPHPHLGDVLAHHRPHPAHLLPAQKRTKRSAQGSL